MAQYVLDKRSFIKGLSLSEELGGPFRDMQGVNVYSQSDVGVLMNANTVVTRYSESQLANSLFTHILMRSDASGIIALSCSLAVGTSITGDNADSFGTLAGGQFTGANLADKRGAAIYHLGTQSQSDIGVFYALETDIGVANLTRAETVLWNADFMSTVPSGASVLGSMNVRHLYVHKKQDILYWNTNRLESREGGGSWVNLSKCNSPTNFEYLYSYNVFFFLFFATFWIQCNNKTFSIF